METQNLWPDFVIDQTRSPKAILKEQAGYLMAKTNNVLSAEVETSQSQDRIVHQFYIVAPALNNYRFMLFSVKHKAFAYYPLDIVTPIDLNDGEGNVIEALQGPVAKNEEEFIRELSSVFNKSENKRIVSSLLSQSLAE